MAPKSYHRFCDHIIGEPEKNFAPWPFLVQACLIEGYTGKNNGKSKPMYQKLLYLLRHPKAG